jgi:hypothetical protein
MQKAHVNMNWENRPSDKTPLCAHNLNKVDASVDEIDDRVIVLDTTKFDKSEAQLLVKKIDFNRTNGIFTITYYNGTIFTIDTLIEKIAVNFDYDVNEQKLIITLDDGETKYVDLKSLITQYEFLDSATIGFSIDTEGQVTSIVKEGSIQEKHLRPDYLADIRVESAKAQSAANTAWESMNTAVSSMQTTNEYRNEVTAVTKNMNDIIDQVDSKLNLNDFGVDDDGNLTYDDEAMTGYIFIVDEYGYLNYTVNGTINNNLYITSFIVGGLYTSGVNIGKEVTNSSRVRSDYIELKDGKHVKISLAEANEQYTVFFYDEDKNCISASDWTSGDYDDVDGAKYVRVVIRNSDNSEIDETKLFTYASYVSYEDAETYADRLLTSLVNVLAGETT